MYHRKYLKMVRVKAEKNSPMRRSLQKGLLKLEYSRLFIHNVERSVLVPLSLSQWKDINLNGFAVSLHFKRSVRRTTNHVRNSSVDVIKPERN